MSRAGARGPPTQPITKNSSTFSLLLFTSNTQYVVITFNQFHYLAELPEKQLAYMYLLKYQVENSYHTSPIHTLRVILFRIFRVENRLITLLNNISKDNVATS